MKTTLQNKTAIFILFVFALFANELTAQTLTFTASPELVTEFTNVNDKGDTTIAWANTGVAKTIITHQKSLTSNGGNTSNVQIISAAGANGSKVFPWVFDGYSHTFLLYEGTVDDPSNALGDLLATVVVVGKAPTTGTITASPETVTEFTDGKGSTTLTVSTQGSPRMLVSLVRTLPDGTVTSGPETVIQNNNPSGTFNVTYIADGFIHTFTLHTGEAGSSVLGDILDTVTVYGGAATLAIEDTKINDIILDVFPNPVVNRLHIETASEIQKLQIYSILGQKLKEIVIGSSQNATIDVSDLEQNIYIVQITTLEGVFSKRFVKK